MSDSLRVAVLGAGSWGTALAHLLASRHSVKLWAYEPEVVDQIQNQRENQSYLPGISLPQSLQATNRLEEVLGGAELVVSVVPSQNTRAVLGEARAWLPADVPLVCASKGIEIGTLMRMGEVFADVLGEGVAETFTVLSGPSFAKEVAAGEPTAVVAASRSGEHREQVQAVFQNERFRVYTNDDVVGVEVGGAMKNVIALAAGVATGLGHGHNTRAALITRGLSEIARLGVRMGARRSTFAGLAGMGDLVLTCTGDLSRNRTVGLRLGQGESLESILSDMNSVAEGKDPMEAVRYLMSRDPKPEDWE